MSKEQTPITAREKFNKEVEELYWIELQNTNGRETDLEMFRKGIEVGLERGNAKVLEALEREVIKIAADLQYQMFIITSNPTTVGDLEYLKIEAFNRSKDYYETEVKPKYK